MLQQPENKITKHFVFFAMNQRFQPSYLEKLTVDIDSSKNKNDLSL